MGKRLLLLLAALLSVLTVATVLLTVDQRYTRPFGGATQIRTVQLTEGGKTREAKLPLSLSGLPHGTEVILSFSLPEEAGDTLFFGSVYAPLTIEANGRVLYRYGTPGTYPSFFGDPPTQYSSIHLPDEAERVIQMRYLSPNERTTLSIHAPLAGTASNILHTLLDQYGLTMALSMFFLFLGLILLALSPFFFRMPARALSFLSPGLLCLVAGAWQFGENTLSVYLLQSPSLLYVLDFLGLFFLPIPLYQMGIFYLGLERNRLLQSILFLAECSGLAAIILQLTGTVSFHRSLFYFHILVPLAILVLTVTALHEFLRRQNRMAGLFFLPFLILTVAAFLELLNFRLHFLPQFSALFQVGLFLFMLTMAVFIGFSSRNLITVRIQNLALENEVKLQEQTIGAQKKRNELLLSHFEEIRRQRHDIRHHLRTLGDMLQKGETDSAAEYIRSVEDSVPTYTPERFCDNQIVSATLSYYAQQARENGITLKIHAQVPETNPNISDANLCVIFGNLLENAIEACQRMRSGSRYITLNAQVRGEVLFITMDNSYDGNLRREMDRFLSSKRPGFGTGLSSLQALAESHSGEAVFRGLENMFQSEVYVRL